MTGVSACRVAAVIGICLLAINVVAQDSKTVIGPSNVPLKEGADALIAGDARDGVRLTLMGLKQARGSRERQSAKSNLCAGYALLEQYAIALPYCDEVLAENEKYWRAYSNRALIYVKLRRFEEANQDLLKGEAISPNASTLRAVRRMYLDATNPVAPTVVIDDRRSSFDDGDSSED